MSFLGSHSILSRIVAQLDRRRKIQLGGLLGLMIIASFAEIFSLGAVIPFLSALVAPEKIFHHPQAQLFIQGLNIQTEKELLLPLTIIFGVAAIIAGVVRILLHYVQLRLSYTIGADFGSRIFERTLHQPYLVHVSRHSSEIISGVEKSSQLINNVVTPLINLISSGLMILFILAALIYINPMTSVTAFIGFTLIYILLFKFSRGRLAKNSGIVSRNANEYNKIIQEGIGGIRDVLMDGTQKVYAHQFRRSFSAYQNGKASNQIIGAVPRFGVEALGMLLIALLALWLSLKSEGIISAIPVLGALALGAQRMLPLIQIIYSAIVTIKGGKQSVIDALDLLEQPMPVTELTPPLPFHNAIEFKNIGFRYTEDTPWVIRDFNLTIPRGSRVGMKGITGSGKSTLLDITMGLLEPGEGTLNIDGVPLTSHGLRRSWQAHIAHVPQSIFLSATTIAENIAFGVPKHKIDIFRVKQCADMAQIAGTIENWPKGYDTQVGERGIRLSGGQRQRIGIARALYKNVDVLILDEATSALDQITEQAVMQAIHALNPELTIIMVAHRLSTLENCDFILDLESGKIKPVVEHVQR
jgi:ATP-binding cassette, subfamily B, bacterial PglK